MLGSLAWITISLVTYFNTELILVPALVRRDVTAVSVVARSAGRIKKVIIRNISHNVCIPLVELTLKVPGIAIAQALVRAACAYGQGLAGIFPFGSAIKESQPDDYN